MEPDRELLRQYAEAGNQPAFAEVVRRHTDLVYSVALRLTGGDAHLAQDVAQKVFTTLAQKAGPLARHASLAGWLHTATRYAASATVRGEHRRRAREQEASIMEFQHSSSEVDWSLLEPLLDEGVGQLAENDRTALLLRYFQGKTHRELAAELGWNEPAARKRVERALEKLREHFAQRGVTITSLALAASVATNSAQAAPAGLAAQLASHSLNQAAQHAGTATFGKVVMGTGKLKGALAAAALGGLAVTPILWLQARTAQLDDANATLERENVALLAQEKQLSGHQRTLRLTSGANANGTYRGPYIPVNVDFLKTMKSGLGFSNPNFTVNAEGAAMLGLTPTETAGLQTVLTELKTQVQNYERTSIREMSPSQVTDDLTQQFLRRNPGIQTVYEIPEMSEQSRADFTQWFSRRVKDVLGPDRAEIVVKVAQGGSDPQFSTHAFDYMWLKPHLSYWIAFSDTTDADGKPKTSWSVISRDTSGSSGGGQSGSSNAVPPELSYLFQTIKSFPPSPK